MYSDSHRRGASGFRLVAVAAVLALVAAACSGVDSPGGTPEGPTGDGESFAREAEGGDPAFEEFLNAPPSPISATVTLDEAGASEATIGPEGGSVEADGSDGAHYRLDFPPGALADEVLIRIVPIADLVSPVISRFIGGVQFEPEGLVMIVPATLTITGVAVPDDVVGYSYSGEGSELVSTPVTTTGDAVGLTVFHFSVTVAGSPSPDAPPNRPTDPRARMRQLLVEHVMRTEECLDFAWIGPGSVTLESYYVNWYKNDVGPMLQAGAVDDMVLGAAIDVFIRWYLLPIAWRQAGLLCDTVPYLEDSGYEFHDKAFELLSTGLVNAIDTAAKVCASAHDLGEARNIVGWTAVALSLDQLYLFPIEDPDREYGLDKLFGCVSFKMVFNTTVLVEARGGPIGISIQSEITDMVPTALAQLLGGDEGDTSGESTAEMERPEQSEQCTVTETIVSRAVRVPVVEPPIPEPRRKVPMPKVGPRTSIGGFGPGRGGSAPGEAKGVMFLQPLEGNVRVEVVCPRDDPITLDFQGQTFNLFNLVQMDEMSQTGFGFKILLDQGSGEVLATKTFDRTVVLGGESITELTTIELIHTPGN